MTYTEERARLLANARAGIKERRTFLSLTPDPPALRDFEIMHDLISNRTFIFHKEELVDGGK